jgi:hypothetical protein
MAKRVDAGSIHPSHMYRSTSGVQISQHANKVAMQLCAQTVVLQSCELHYDTFKSWRKLLPHATGVRHTGNPLRKRLVY